MLSLLLISSLNFYALGKGIWKSQTTTTVAEAAENRQLWQQAAMLHACIKTNPGQARPGQAIVQIVAVLNIFVGGFVCRDLVPIFLKSEPQTGQARSSKTTRRQAVAATSCPSLHVSGVRGSSCSSYQHPQNPSPLSSPTL